MEANKQQHKATLVSALPLLKRMNSGNIHFSGDAVESGKAWVFVTAGLAHGSISHLVNNMIMMIPVMGGLESLLTQHDAGGGEGGQGEGGGNAGLPLARTVALLYLIYFLTGAAGFMMTYRRNYNLNPELWNVATKFMSTCGSSPSTYGIMFFAAAAYPNHRVADSAGIPAWVWQWLVWLLPVALNSRYGILDVVASIPSSSLLHSLCTKTTKEVHSKGTEKKKKKKRATPTAQDHDDDKKTHAAASNPASARKKPIKRPFLMSTILMVGVLPLLQANFSSSGLSNTDWMYMYLIKTAFLKAFDSLALGYSVGASDHSCHLGGALMGIAAAFTHLMIFGWRAVQNSSSSSSSSSSSVEGEGQIQVVYSGVLESLKAIVTESPPIAGDGAPQNLVSRYILIMSVGYLIFRLLIEDWIYVYISGCFSKTICRSIRESNLLFTPSGDDLKRQKHE